MAAASDKFSKNAWRGRADLRPDCHGGVSSASHPKVLSGLVRSDAVLNRLRELVQDFSFLDFPCGSSSTKLSLSTIRLAIPHCSSCPRQTLRSAEADLPA
jgi:hypothetical protein